MYECYSTLDRFLIFQEKLWNISENIYLITPFSKPNILLTFRNMECLVSQNTTERKNGRVLNLERTRRIFENFYHIVTEFL